MTRSRDLIEHWSAIARRLLHGTVDLDDLMWVDRSFTSPERLYPWLSHRRAIAPRRRSGRGAVPGAAATPHRSRVRRQVAELGFLRAWVALSDGAGPAARRELATELATLVLDHESLAELELAVYSSERLPDAWAGIEADAGRPFRVRLYDLRHSHRRGLTARRGTSTARVSTACFADRLVVEVGGIGDAEGRVVLGRVVPAACDELYTRPEALAAGEVSDAVCARTFSSFVSRVRPLAECRATVRGGAVRLTFRPGAGRRVDTNDIVILALE